ncbi:MAG: aldehyde dehydrogenase family protein, partial [Armatimonadetes bacterium]|nr:aldehyde dehydrogenase family protein [Armatimonadota bacterium]
MDMLIGGEWVSKDTVREIRSPYDGSVVDTVPAADADDVKAAIDAAEQGAAEMAAMPAHKRCSLLRRASELLSECQEEIAQLLAHEVGKTINEGRGEASRPPAIFDHCADAARHIAGEVIPFDAASGGENRQG